VLAVDLYLRQQVFYLKLKNLHIILMKLLFLKKILRIYLISTSYMAGFVSFMFFMLAIPRNSSMLLEKQLTMRI